MFLEDEYINHILILDFCHVDHRCTQLMSWCLHFVWGLYLFLVL